MAKSADLYVGNQLFVGPANHLGAPIPPVGFGIGPTKIRGAAYLAGPVMIGSPLTFTKGPNFNEANLMIGRSGNVEALPPPLSIVKVSSFGFPPTPLDVVLGDILGPVGISINASFISILGVTNAVGILNWIGVKNFIGLKAQTGLELRAGASVDTGAEVTTGAVAENTAGRVINGAVVINGALHVNGFVSWLSSIVGTTKLFDIIHPTKKNHRLRHACLEGPEHGVYHRGRLTSNNVIELPEYWRGLVDPETITVNLTPHGIYQELFVQKIEWGSRIYVMNNGGGPIDCSYVVYGERKDVAKLELEYEGTEMIYQDIERK